MRLGGRFGSFLFFLSGEGKGEPKGPEGGGGTIFHGQIPGGGRVGAGGRGAGRVFEGNLGGGGGAKYFSSGPKFPPSYAPFLLPKSLRNENCVQEVALKQNATSCAYACYCKNSDEFALASSYSSGQNRYIYVLTLSMRARSRRQEPRNEQNN